MYVSLNLAHTTALEKCDRILILKMKQQQGGELTQPGKGHSGEWCGWKGLSQFTLAQQLLLPVIR